MTKLIALDTETTGLDPRHEWVFEIATIDLETDEERVWTLEPPHKYVEAMHPKAAEVNRFHERTSDPDWRWDVPLTDVDRPDPEALGRVLAEVRDVLDFNHVIGAVPQFDTRFLEQLFDRYSIDGRPRWHYHLVDIENVAVGWLLALLDGDKSKLLTQPPYDSDNLARACGVPVSTEDRHTALGDARMVARWWRTLRRGSHD